MLLVTLDREILTLFLTDLSLSKTLTQVRLGSVITYYIFGRARGVEEKVVRTTGEKKIDFRKKIFSVFRLI